MKKINSIPLDPIPFLTSLLCLPWVFNFKMLCSKTRNVNRLRGEAKWNKDNNWSKKSVYLVSQIDQNLTHLTDNCLTSSIFDVKLHWSRKQVPQLLPNSLWVVSCCPMLEHPLTLLKGFSVWHTVYRQSHTACSVRSWGEWARWREIWREQERPNTV